MLPNSSVATGELYLAEHQYSVIRQSWLENQFRLDFGLYPGIPLDYKSMPGESVSFSVPLDDFTVVKEPVTFELNIPVKVVMYLRWLNDRLIDLSAPVPYKEEVLHCRFTSPYCLK